MPAKTHYVNTTITTKEVKTKDISLIIKILLKSDFYVELFSTTESLSGNWFNFLSVIEHACYYASFSSPPLFLEVNLTSQFN